MQAVKQIYDRAAAEAFGLADGQVCVMIYCGSRGLGHQACSDHVQIMDKAMARYQITVPDRQLACAPADSPKAAATWARWPRPRTTAGPTASCCPRPPARSSPTDLRGPGQPVLIPGSMGTCSYVLAGVTGAGAHSPPPAMARAG